jgi:hypothetical protein
LSVTNTEKEEIEMSNGDPGEVPIIVQGGNSVEIDMSVKFKDNGAGTQGRKLRNAEHHLVKLTIDGGEPITLRPDSTIVITCK